jgi:hypothetical protein
MRRFVVLGLLVCLAAPTAAWGLRRAPGDGTLAVRNGDGQLTLTLRDGVAIGKLDGGVLEIASPDLADCADLNVWGSDRGPALRTRERVDGTIVTRCVFQEFLIRGTREATRFRLVLQNATLYIRNGTSFSLSVVGRGQGFIRGAGGFFDGMYSVNGDAFASLPDEGERFPLAANATLR